MKRLLLALLVSSIAHADAASVKVEMKALRSLPEAERGARTGALAREIAALPDGRLGLALSLANLATEGDAGAVNLQLVTDTLGAAVAAAPPGEEATRSYATLANLARYEGMVVRPAIAASAPYVAALAQLVQQDRDVEQADFALKDASGKTWSKKALHGKVVLLNFWATWCPPCRAELPSLEAIAAKNDGLVVLAVTDEDPQKVAAFLRGGTEHVHVLFDPSRATIERFYARGIPRTYVFDRNGKLAATAIDGRTRAQLEQMLRKAGL